MQRELETSGSLSSLFFLVPLQQAIEDLHSEEEKVDLLAQEKMQLQKQVEDVSTSCMHIPGLRLIKWLGQCLCRLFLWGPYGLIVRPTQNWIDFISWLLDWWNDFHSSWVNYPYTANHSSTKEPRSASDSESQKMYWFLIICVHQWVCRPPIMGTGASYGHNSRQLPQQMRHLIWITQIWYTLSPLGCDQCSAGGMIWRQRKFLADSQNTLGSSRSDQHPPYSHH